MLKHKAGIENKVADALSRSLTILVAVSTEVLGFDILKDDYETCPDFGEIYIGLRDGLFREQDDYFLQNEFLFRANRLCVPQTSVRDFIVREIHAGGLAGHFGKNKTIMQVEEQFYWPSLKHDVANIVI